MEKETRQRLERLTQQARRLLEQEFREQLEGRYDILLDGRIPLTPGAHLSPRERVLWDKLVAAVAHKRSQGITAAAAVAAYLREAAFHTLNRFVALKMLEARKLVQACISRGEDSAGFKEFIALAPGLVALPDKGYRLYVETIFDEIAQEVRALFDRRDAATLLWPRRQALLDLLAALNDPEVASVWGEDETIGWVYQYFNGEDERRQMRAESQAPRNSRELAVRNQFFTPRYVVQFLTDNSLGLTWCEMRGGDTQLAHLDYLVKPEGGFEERAPKDPRDLRVLDPACGSGHFLLYAFDLLAGDPTRSFFGIYEEAWRAEAAAKSEVTGRTLKEDYGSELALRRAVPELILKHNLHGVDIDPRAAQIAGLALWMRAQRAYKDHKIAAQDRPPIGRTNIVTAEPMPGDRSMVAEFASTLRPQVLGELFQRMVEEMRLAGELGSLLKIERALQSAVAKAREQFLREQRESQKFLPGLDRPRNPQLEFDLSGVSDESFFDSAEERIVQALQQYAAGAPASLSVRRQLFAEDAAQGIAFIDLCRKHFDAVLMNPPFGYAPESFRPVIGERITDIDALFVSRGVELLEGHGRLGVITNRTQLMKPALADFRTEHLQSTSRMLVCADLGSGVLDALVETAAFVVERDRVADGAYFLNALGDRDKQASIRTAVGASQARPVDVQSFRAIPGNRFAHWIEPDLLNLFSKVPPLEKDCAVSFGLSTTDNFRFMRLRWELDPQVVVRFGQAASGWVPIAKGGEYSPYVGDIHLAVDWRQRGAALRAMPGAPIRNEHVYGKPGLTFTKRTASAFAPRVLPAGCIVEVNGPSIQFSRPSPARLFQVLGVLLSRVSSYLTDALVAAGDTSVAGSAAKDYIPGVIGVLPVPAQVDILVSDLVAKICHLAAIVESLDETSANFSGPISWLCGPEANSERFERAVRWLVRNAVRRAELAEEYLKTVERDFGLSASARQVLDSVVGPLPGDTSARVERMERAMILDEPRSWSSSEQLVNQALRAGITRKDVSKNAFHADRLIELVCSLAGLSAAEAGQVLVSGYVNRDAFREQEMSFAVGVAFGRWDLRTVNDAHLQVGMEAVSVEEIGARLFGPIALTAPCARDSTCWREVLVDDPGAPEDIVSVLAAELDRAAAADGRRSHWLSTEETSPEAFRTWVRVRFFDYHIAQYSKSRRKAPIYWQLATASGSYSVWIYIHRATGDTLFRVLNDFVGPKLDHEKVKLDGLTQKAGANSSAAQRREIEQQETLVGELQALKIEVARVAPLWKPNLDDGVILNFAPLWRLVPQTRSWQSECKKAWDELVAGEYDWAHIAMHLWPERVVPKCIDDRSLAIAHGLEDVFWHEDDSGTWRKSRVNDATVQELIQERSSTTVRAALNDLLSAATPTASKGRKAKGRSGSPRPSAAKSAPAAARATAPDTAADETTLRAVKAAIATVADGASKADVLAATGLSDGDWSKAIAALLDRGVVTRTGQKRGTRYHADSPGEDG